MTARRAIPLRRLENFTMRLPVLDLFTPFPGDYRGRQTVLREAARNHESSEE